MPRRNHNAGRPAIDIDALADEVTGLAAELTTVLPPAYCAGCGTSPATHGGYCLPCTGRIVLDARASITRR